MTIEFFRGFWLRFLQRICCLSDRLDTQVRLPILAKPIHVFDTNIFVAVLRSRRGAVFVAYERNRPP